jgi:hypothetical protein
MVFSPCDGSVVRPTSCASEAVGGEAVPVSCFGRFDPASRR